MKISIGTAAASCMDAKSMGDTANAVARLGVSAREVAYLMDTGRVFLIDVREPEEFKEARIRGALLCPLSEIDPVQFAGLASRSIIFCCGTGRRAAQAVERLLAAGLRNVDYLSGGLKAWSADGLAVRRGNE